MKSSAEESGDAAVNDNAALDTTALLVQSTDTKCFAYDTPFPEETGPWIPVSIPPTGLGNGAYDVSEVDFFPHDSVDNSLDLTAWRILIESVAFLCGAHKQKRRLNKGLHHDGMAALASRDCDGDGFDPFAFSLLSDQADDHVRDMSAVLAAEPPQWLPDSHADICMLCKAHFRPIVCSRHHCRFCGLVFCGFCTSQRTLLPVKFREKNPQRVCDCCYERLAPVQGLLVEQVSAAAQPATHDVTNFTCWRAWINSPIDFSMEGAIYKATNTLQSFMEIGKLKAERTIPEIVLKNAKGLAVLTVIKVGAMFTYKVGTGLVIAKRRDGSWSAPSAIISSGIGWGPQGGGEIIDFVLVLRNIAAVSTFAGQVHLSLGAGVSVAAGPLGRTLEADIRAGDGGAAACYTYSLSKGVFAGFSLEGNVVMTREWTNVQFYGDPSINAMEILLGSQKQPKAAAPLYVKLAELFGKTHGSR